MAIVAASGSRSVWLASRATNPRSPDGRAENMGESWAMTNVLGNKQIPNRVDPWGPEWHHDWPTWRAMLPKYLDELVP